ncbi:hypothetical protein BDQ17DRAFT_1430295 [Cyathus striatus]|nr:hypothetical protein BDQ17DRAFT_1430295 [Cyathus striatus]
MYNPHRRILLTKERLAKFEGCDSPFASSYEGKQEGIYVPVSAVLPQKQTRWRRMCKIDHVKVDLPSDILKENKRLNKGDDVRINQYDLEGNSGDERKKVLARLSDLKDSEVPVRELDDLEVVRGEEEEERPAKRMRWSADGIDENQVPRSRKEKGEWMIMKKKAALAEARRG